MSGPEGDRVRLVLLLEDLNFGGTQRYAVQLAAHLDKTRFQTEIWTLRGGRDFAPYVAEHGLTVIDLTDAGRVGPRAILRLFARLMQERPDVLYTLTVLPNIWGRLAAGLLRIPLVSGYRNHRPQQFEGALHRLSRRIIANAERLKGTLIEECGVPPGKIAVIPNGVDTERFHPRDREEAPYPLIVAVARLVPRKDLPTLVEAFRLLRRGMPEAHLQIIGDGPIVLDKAAHVDILPGSSDVPTALSHAHLFALSSIDEGAPNAILEAMASGLPVVATSAGGVAEVVDHGRTGLVVPPGDPAALAEALASLLQDKDRREAMGQAGRGRAIEEFSIARMVAETQAVLIEAARSRKA